MVTRLILALLLLATLTGEARAQGSLVIPNDFTGKSSAPIAQFVANWSTIAAYVNAREIVLGTLATRPTAGVSGRLYVATDISGGTLYQDNGTTWTQIAGAAAGGLLQLFNGASAPALPVTGQTFWFNPTLNTLNGYDGTGWQSDAALATKIFNVLDSEWGAIADNATNVSTKIQAAINAAAAAGGGIVYLPAPTVAGNCYMAAMLQLKNNVYIVGAGKGATCVKAPNNTATTSTNGSTADSNGHYGLSVFTNILTHNASLATSRSTDPNNALYLIARTGVMDMTIDNNWAGQAGYTLTTGNWAALTGCVSLANVTTFRIERVRCINGAGYQIMIGYSNQGGSDYGHIYDNDVLTYNPAGVGYAMITGKFNDFRGNYDDGSAPTSFDQEPNLANEVARANTIRSNLFLGALRIQAPFASNIMTDMRVEDNDITGGTNTPVIILDHDTTGGAILRGNRLRCNGGATSNWAIRIIAGTSALPTPTRIIANNRASGCNYFFVNSSDGTTFFTSPIQNVEITGNVYAGKFWMHLPVPYNVLVAHNQATLSGGANTAQALIIGTGANATYPTAGNTRFTGNLVTGSGVTAQIDFQASAGWTDTNWTPDFLIFDANTFDVAGNAANPMLFGRSVTWRNNVARQITAKMILSATGNVVNGNLCYDNATPPALVTPANCFDVSAGVGANPGLAIYNGLILGGATGGDKGAGTINAAGAYYANGIIGTSLTYTMCKTGACITTCTIVTTNGLVTGGTCNP